MVGYRTISFDMEGTLITHSFSNYIWEEAIPMLYAEVNDLPLKVAKSLIFEEYDAVGEEDLLWYDVAYWFTRLGIPGIWCNLLPLAAKKCRVYPEVYSVLDQLSDKYPLIIVSNTIREFLDVQLSFLKTNFERVFSAPSDYGLLKKDPKFYSIILEELDLEPGEIAHVGDHYIFDYEVPRSIGMPAYHLDREGDGEGEGTVRDLEDFEMLVEP
ncbi:MAG: HAD family hydrolase [Candidatus Bathyarchaeia archaeon]